MSKQRRRISILIPPDGGWKPHAFYHVECSVAWNNPIHSAVLYTGFLNGVHGQPGGYANIVSHDEHTPFHQLVYLRVIRLLIDNVEYKNIPHKWLTTPDDLYPIQT